MPKIIIFLFVTKLFVTKLFVTKLFVAYISECKVFKIIKLGIINV